MPWVTEINKTYTLTDKGPSGTVYSDCAAMAKLTIQTSGTELLVNVDMTTKESPYISMYLKVNGEELIKKTYFKNSSEFPIKNGSGMGFVRTLEETDASIPVVFKILTSQDFTGNTDRFDDAPTVKATLTRTYYTNVGKGTVSITDNYNNTFTVKGTAGAAGTGNSVTSYSVTYGYDSRATNANPSTPITLTMTNTANATRTVWAKTTTKGMYGEDSVASTSAAIKQYVAPSNPGSPVLSASKTPKRVLKKEWTFDWVPSTAANATSPIKGYRIRVYKNGTPIKGLKVDSGYKIAKGTGTTEWLDREISSAATLTTLTFIPEDLGFAAGDKLKISLFAYTRYGITNTGGQLFSGNGSTAVNSSEYTIENAGVMQVNVNGAWKEGQVFVNVDGAWKEAESVYTNVNGSWKESI